MRNRAPPLPQRRRRSISRRAHREGGLVDRRPPGHHLSVHRHAVPRTDDNQVPRDERGARHLARALRAGCASGAGGGALRAGPAQEQVGGGREEREERGHVARRLQLRALFDGAPDEDERQEHQRLLEEHRPALRRRGRGGGGGGQRARRAASAPPQRRRPAGKRRGQAPGRARASLGRAAATQLREKEAKAPSATRLFIVGAPRLRPRTPSASVSRPGPAASTGKGSVSAREAAKRAGFLRRDGRGFAGGAARRASRRC